MLSHPSFRTSAVAIAALFLAPAAACASIFVPGELSPGATYHLAFVTDGTTAATSADIETYNTFVRNEAGRSGAITEGWGIDWFAIGSTEDIDARDNAVVSAPIYLLDGTMLATGYGDLWDGTLNDTFSVSQFGSSLSINSNLKAWSGSKFNGVGSSSRLLGSGTPTLGYLHQQYKSHYNSYLHVYGLSRWKTETHHMYALSAELAVPIPSEIPEPTSLLVWAGLATAGVWVTRRRRRKP